MKISVSNSIVEFTPKLPLKAQKILLLVLWNTNMSDFIEAKENRSSIFVKIKKEELFNIFWNKDKKKTRRDFYESKKYLHELIKINTDDKYIETSYISSTEEEKYLPYITFEIPFYLFCWCADFDNWNFFQTSILDLSKLKKRYSLILYQYFKTKIFSKRAAFTPKEFNNLMGTNMTPSAILWILKNTREDFWSNGIEIDYSIEVGREKNRITQFKITFTSNESLEDYSAFLMNETLSFKSSIDNYNEKDKFQYIINLLKWKKEGQIMDLFNLYNPKDSIESKITDKIIANCWKEKKTISFYIFLIASVQSFKISDISKKVNNAIIEISKGKIEKQTAFVFSRIKQLLINEK